MPSDWEIAREVKLKPIEEVAEKLGIDKHSLLPYGRYKAKIEPVHNPASKSKLILVTSINPTPAGEGKTTTTIGLGDGLNRLGKKATMCLREPSLGPCFGVKGGATGGGHAQVGPLEEINLHFTGDFHAITSAHNLLAATIDNHIYWGNQLDLDLDAISWRRVLDMNDRALRAVGLDFSTKKRTLQRTGGFDITVASEIMAIFCLAKDQKDLEQRLNRMVIAKNTNGEMIKAEALEISGALLLLLQEAIKPNLVQTLEGNPAFIHGGPFANIAHGCNSLIATRTGLGMCDYVVTEAGFGADLGAEKFFDIKCRVGDLKPDAAVVVVTVRALKHHGGVAKEDLGTPNLAGLQAGLVNVGRHINNMKKFGLPVAVALNSFITDSPEEHKAVADFTAEHGVTTYLAEHWEHGSRGITELAEAVVDMCETPSTFKPLYDLKQPLFNKINTIATELYGASGVVASNEIREQLTAFEQAGYGDLPVCMAKTPFSFSADPKQLGAPSGHEIHLREVRLSAGSGMLVALCGDVMTMPGLPREPAAKQMGIDSEGRAFGLA